MAIKFGSGGSAAWTDGTISLGDGEVDWTLEITGETISTNSMDEAVYEARLGSWLDYTATVTVLDADILFTEINLFAAVGATGVLALGDGTKTWTSSANGAMLETVNKTVDANDVVRHTFNFVGTGAITVA